MTCRHCSTRKVTRPRGLCWSCYYTPGVKRLYFATSKYAPSYAKPNDDEPVVLFDLPSQPCYALPGSPERLATLAGRVSQQEPLWHPDDARL